MAVAVTGGAWPVAAGPLGGAGKSWAATPSSAVLMKRAQTSAGRPPPVGSPSMVWLLSRLPIHTTAVRLGVNPANQASP